MLTDRSVHPGPRLEPLLEREREVDSIERLLERAATGDGAVGVIEGRMGIGKTRLLRESRARAQRAGFTVLAGRCSELEREFPFGLVRQLFEPIVTRDVGHLGGAAARARAVLAIDDGPERTLMGSDPSFASLDGLFWLTVHLSEQRPLLLAVDDLQWCDAPSLRFLSYLGPRLEGLPVLVVCSLRPSDRGPSSVLAAALAGDPSTVRVFPGPLTVAAAAELIYNRFGAPAEEEFTAACHLATGGNPLLLGELLKELSARGVAPDRAHLPLVKELGPRAISHAVLVRLSRLPAAATPVAEALAVLGDGAELAHVAALAGLDQDATGAAVGALVHAEIVQSEPPLGFVHPLVAAAIHQDLVLGERELRHRRAAELLHDAGAPAEQIAGHLLLTPVGGHGWAVEVLTLAASEALRKGAPESAIAYLQRALREPPPPAGRAELLLELGCAEALTDGPSAAEHLHQAYELLDGPDSRAIAALTLSRVLLLTGQPAAGVRLAQDAAAALPPGRDDTRDQLEALELMARMIAGGIGDALGRLERYYRTPVRPTLGAKMLAAVATQEWMATGGDSEACAKLALGALAGGDLIAANNGLLAVGPIGVLAFADRAEALDACERALAEAHRAGSLLDLKAMILARGFTLYWRGELADAEESLRSFYEAVLWGIGQPIRMYGDTHLSAVLRERGDLVGARLVLEQSSDPGDDGEATRYWVHSQLELLVAEGRMSEALAVSEEFEARFAPAADSIDNPWRSPTALALHRLRRQDEALALAHRDLEPARRWGAPGTVSRALRILGTVQGDAGLETLRHAVDVAAGTPARLQHAKALAALGAALRRARRPSDARTPLRHAVELAEVLRADRLAEEARHELYAAGARPRRAALSGVKSLTASEHRVATLAAEGHTNREIAETLFVTPKTVEMHLGNVYRKLGVVSRRELPAALNG